MEVVQGFEKICKIATTEEQKLRIEKLKADIKTLRRKEQGSSS